MTRPRSRMDGMDLYYAGGGVELYHGSALDDPEKWTHATALITDPPYGVGYTSLPRGGAVPVIGDEDTGARDAALAAWGTLRLSLSTCCKLSWDGWGLWRAGM